jgi:hypothetical protein
MESEFPSSGANDDVRTLAQLLSEDHSQEHDLSFYNPFMGNLCAVGQFFGLPIVATPSGPGASQLAITIAAHRPLQEPCFNLLAPKSSLINPLSTIYQVATLPMNSGMGEFEGIDFSCHRTLATVMPRERERSILTYARPPSLISLSHVFS